MKKNKSDKAEEIKIYIQEKEINMDKIREFSRTQGGFINENLRYLIWPKLLGFDIIELEKDRKIEIVSNIYSEQIEKDVERSLYNITNETGLELKNKRNQLSRILNYLFSKNEDIHYFQGKD
jgi:hypothetical protein